ncbi:MAG TPA: ABC transporter substrate-binding protein [Calditrichia bacterium]|nr:ABC transporter substrate-binding protein [Calditrichota bacterium]HQU71133.1 ABC transporter substrate-binding protein [Calditrichia bacterium]HQV32420.1 ABC transporter substrate-binding protein [Calditrichia bacterium]
MPSVLYRFWGIALLAGFLACSPERDAAPSASPTTANRYARGFSIQQMPGYRLVTLTHPWEPGKNFAQYALIPRGAPRPVDLPEGVALIHTPLQRVVLMSTAHAGFIAALGAQETVAGIGEKQYLSDSLLLARIGRENLPELGRESAFNFETMIALAPEVVFFSGLSEMNDRLTRLQAAGIVPFYWIEWMEKHPLGRAEWIKLLGALMQEDAAAERFFAERDSAYQALLSRSADLSRPREVLLASNYQGTWYMPGGHSFMAALLKDAGARYGWESDSSAGSLPLSFEVVLEKRLDAEVWLHPGAYTSLGELADADPRYRSFRSFQNGMVFNNDRRLNGRGGNDYWESGLVNPHLILADLIHILHPQLLPAHQLVYHRQLR